MMVMFEFYNNRYLNQNYICKIFLKTSVIMNSYLNDIRHIAIQYLWLAQILNTEPDLMFIGPCIIVIVEE